MHIPIYMHIYCKQICKQMHAIVCHLVIADKIIFEVSLKKVLLYKIFNYHTNMVISMELLIHVSCNT